MVDDLGGVPPGQYTTPCALRQPSLHSSWLLVPLATSLRSVAHSRLHIYSSTPLNSLHLPGWAALRSCCLSMRRLMALRNASTYVSYLKISE